VLQHASAAQERGIIPQSAEAATVVDSILDGTPTHQHRRQLLAQLEAGTDARAERYWQLVGIINGWPSVPAHVPAFECSSPRSTPTANQPSRNSSAAPGRRSPGSAPPI
jgi:hypothetical protein